jgi:murein L,D-transpeptidase YcbB/YkuD
MSFLPLLPWRAGIRCVVLSLTLLASPMPALVRAQAPPAAAEAAMPLRWFTDGQPRPAAQQAIALLTAAETHGLVADDYDATGLAQAIERAAAGGEPAPAALDEALTAAVLRYLHDLHFGRIDPAAVHQHFARPARQDFDLRLLLDEALVRQRLPELARGLAPQLPAYERLRAALAEYRLLARDPAWQTALPALPGASRDGAGKLVAGQAWPGVEQLAQRLRVLGDLEPGAVVPAIYAEPLITAVQRFQERHGLPVDGVLGRATRAQLEVTPAARVRQIELGLERARWTPLTQGRRMILINIPEFVLRAYEVEGDRIEVREQMRVIVGKALDTRTPLFDEDLRFIEFSPYWNVPPSIARAELVPKLRRKPGEWAREGYEFVLGDGRVQTTLSAATLDAVLAGNARIRQRPGERNALGDIKFVFPNADNIYLHHTPSVGLFARERRDFSHGCIRVEAPLALAKFVLRDQPDWTEARIIEAMTAGESKTLKLDEPIPVLIAYGTALVKQGRLHFFDDIYGHDRLLDAALRRRPPATPDRHSP